MVPGSNMEKGMEYERLWGGYFPIQKVPSRDSSGFQRI